MIMAFISQIKPGYPYKHFIKFKKNTSGSGGGRVSSGIGFKDKKIDIQIDFEEKNIRIGECENGFSCDANGTFSCPNRVTDTVGTERILLTDGGDGWWYGSYAKPEGE